MNDEKIYLNIKQAVESAQHKVYVTVNFVMIDMIKNGEMDMIGFKDESHAYGAILKKRG